LQFVETLFQRGFHRQALSELELALAATPRCLEARRLQVEILLAMGRIGAARAVIEDFVAANPDMPETQEFADILSAAARDRNELVARQEASLLEQSIPPTFRLHEADLDRRSRLELWDGLKNQMNVFGALIIRETVNRFSESKIGFLWAVLEPTVQVGFLIMIFMIGMHKIPYGMSIGLFIATGMLPFLFFMNTYTRAANTLRATGGILAHTLVKPLDLVFSASILQAALDFMLLVMFLTGVAIYGDPVRIQDPPLVGFCILMMWCAGVGLGLAVDAFARRFHAARLVGWILVRKAFFASGLFFAPDQLPSWLEKIAMYNPLLNLITVIRTSFSPFVHVPGLSLGYGVKWCLAIFLFGWGAHLSAPPRR
jgi:capsular polysaccharide transport system permease protein